MDSAILCKFSRNVDAKALVAELFDAPFEDLLAVGRRVVDLERHFNNQRGFDRDDDTLPYEIAGFDAALDAYYEQRGWRPDGTVPREQVPG